MIWILIGALLSMLFTRKMSLSRKVSKVYNIRYADGQYYCSFVWGGQVYHNGFFLLPDDVKLSSETRFEVLGRDAATGYWQLKMKQNG